MNQIRAWVREGRTDAWIAHQLEVPAAELREFRRKHALTADDEPDGSADLRDAIEAEVEAATLADAESAEAEDADEDEDEVEDEPADDVDGELDDERDRGDDGEGSEQPRKRRRRRGGRGRKRGSGALEATFDHGEKDGVGLWLDPAVQDNPVYAEHWAGHRPVEVSIEADQITIRRSGGE